MSMLSRKFGSQMLLLRESLILEHAEEMTLISLITVDLSPCTESYPLSEQMLKLQIELENIWKHFTVAIVRWGMRYI